MCLQRDNNRFSRAVALWGPTQATFLFYHGALGMLFFLPSVVLQRLSSGTYLVVYLLISLPAPPPHLQKDNAV
jgi:hypothetical protein